ncbi:cytochrome bc complex cytochrome b subunit [uncultured Gulosibacter sp.]|uniref:cytochrome bc1 complex cytochrome b subunit n=1 Tax=uncultured Gulosibacter sp. TaxID=1339167 RepID=UPI002889883A|nr:cytochrome bc complex cytochrome b subunit [uncultured Gulosibacter sp.]
MTTTYSSPVAEGSRLAKASNWIDERTSISGAVKEFGRKIFPDHWSFMLGEVALYSFIAILISGTFLTFFFDPSMTHMVYDGQYVPLKGMGMSAAMASTLDISFDVRGGLLMRQVHHWAALLFVASTMMHMARVFFTGAFRKPRELNWLIGLVLWIIAMLEGFSGYSLPDDLLSGNGLRIVDGMIKAIPGIGTWMSFWLFGGEFPGDMIVGRLYSLHIMILPAALIAFLAMHLLLMVVHKHTQWPGAGHTEKNVVGNPVLPVFAAKATGFLFIVIGFIYLIATFFQINPIWNYGPYDPSPVSAGTQPDWYIGFGDGALRLIPPGWEVPLGNYTLSLAILVPFLLMGIFVIGLFVYPFMESFITGDKREHHLLDRPRNAPTRTALGAAWVNFYATMWAAASSDLIATHFHMAMEHVIHFLQFWLIVGSVIVFIVTKRWCLALQRRDRSLALHGIESGRVIRLPHGEFQEVEVPLEPHDQWQLVSYESYAPIIAQPDPKTGKVRAGQKLRATLSRWFYSDRVEAPTAAEIEAARAAHHGEIEQ